MPVPFRFSRAAGPFRPFRNYPSLPAFLTFQIQHPLMGQSNAVAGIHCGDWAGGSGVVGCLLSRSDARFDRSMHGGQLPVLQCQGSRAMHRSLHQVQERRDNDVRDGVQPPGLALTGGIE